MTLPVLVGLLVVAPVLLRRTPHFFREVRVGVVALAIKLAPVDYAAVQLLLAEPAVPRGLAKRVAIRVPLVVLLPILYVRFLTARPH